jgi:hypothetical protein
MSRSLTISAMLITLAALGIVAVILIGRGQQVGASHDSDEHASNAESERTTVGRAAPRQAGCTPGAPVDNIVVDTSLNAANETQLVNVSDNVFVGQVVRRIDDAPLPEAAPLPTTAFAVEVKENIKGSLSGTVTVVQGGGCDPEYGRVVLINNNPLLVPGQEVLFTTSEDSPGGTHSLASHTYSSVRLETASEKARVVAKFQEAKKRAASIRSSRSAGRN